jgi:hypothetical protein
MKRHENPSKKLNLDKQAVRELKRIELGRLEHSVSGGFRTLLEPIDNDDGGGKC